MANEIIEKVLSVYPINPSPTLDEISAKVEDWEREDISWGIDMALSKAEQNGLITEGANTPKTFIEEHTDEIIKLMPNADFFDFLEEEIDENDRTYHYEYAKAYLLAHFKTPLNEETITNE